MILYLVPDSGQYVPGGLPVDLRRCLLGKS